MNQMMRNWRHIFKVDPAKNISDDALRRICESGTDALIIGGTDHITLKNVIQLLSRIKQYNNLVPCILEISTIKAITFGFDHYFIPMVMNSTEKKWLMDIQHQAIKKYHRFMNWDTISMEGYCILNQESKAFVKTSCQLPDHDDVTAYAYMAERVFNLPIFYMEYSGTYGEPELVRKVKNQLSNTLLFYGGGIENRDQASEMKAYADVIIVGNSLYDNLTEALRTVDAVK